MNEPRPARCKCKKRVNDQRLKEMLATAEIVELFGHAGEYGYTGRRKKTPRTPTIESAHILAGLERQRRRRAAHETREIERLRLAVEEDRLARAEEIRLRWEIYHELDREMRAAITVPEVDDGWQGRSIFVGITADNRSSIGTDRSPLDRDSFVPDVFEIEESSLAADDVVERDLSLEDSPESTELVYADTD